MGEADLAQPQARSTEEANAALVRGLRERAPEACAQLYDRFAPGLHRFAVTRLGDVETAEEVVVETMVSAVRDIRRFNPRRSSLAAWVYGIARRRVQMEIRRQRRRKSVPASVQVSTEAAREISDGGDLAASAAARLDSQRKVADLRNFLSHVEMEVLLLSCVEQLPAREVGQAIGRSERAVHSILHRAKRKARGRLVGDE
jgi:RNA polymerase sigma-70 factor (ECF subfamily)